MRKEAHKHIYYTFTYTCVYTTNTTSEEVLLFSFAFFSEKSTLVFGDELFPGKRGTYIRIRHLAFVIRYCNLVAQRPIFVGKTNVLNIANKANRADNKYIKISIRSLK